MLVFSSHAVLIFKPPNDITINQIQSLQPDVVSQATKGNSPLVATGLPAMSFVPPESSVLVSVYHRDPTVYSPDTTSTFGKYWRVARPKGGTVFNHKYQPAKISSDHPLYSIRSPLTICKNHFLSIVPQGFSRRVGRTINEYNIYSLYSGECRFQLYHPKYQKFLPAIKSKFSNYQYTEVLDHKLEHDNHDTRHAKFIEIILRPGQALFIPSVWSYGYTATTASTLLNTVTNNPFTYTFQAGYHLSSLFLTTTT